MNDRFFWQYSNLHDDWYKCEFETYPVLRWIYTCKHGRFYIYPKGIRSNDINC